MGMVGDGDKFDGDRWGWGQIPVPVQLFTVELLGRIAAAKVLKSTKHFNLRLARFGKCVGIM